MTVKATRTICLLDVETLQNDFNFIKRRFSNIAIFGGKI